MKIYTKTGDKGETALFGGKRVSKTHPRIAAYGTVDELNSVVGMAAASCSEESVRALRRIQHDLLDVGAELATPAENEAALARSALITEERVDWLEAEMDRMEEHLRPLETFILPGGSAGAAGLHLARTVCRRAEREILELDEGEVRGVLIRYINRLSDYFFVLARDENRLSHTPDISWEKPK